MAEEIKETYYTIVQRPYYVTFRCPHCGWKHEIDWDDFSIHFDGDVEREMWRGHCNDEFICDDEDCGKTFRLDGVEID
ncbi:phage terminase large subunit family protein [Aerococcaceae bacterium NML160702]|nr:phage terminase large subunit family protein [Aerococcaceae bacterium NML190073]MCW6681524.1 phage terminase large subunit family protein [Aerococcaceae bacterium NML160702]